jgi:hypothetical protein
MAARLFFGSGGSNTTVSFLSTPSTPRVDESGDE